VAAARSAQRRGRIGDLFALAQLGRGVGRLPLEEQRHLLDFFTKSAAEILQRYFSHELVQALFGFDSVVGNFASPHTPGSAYVLLHHVFGEAAGVPGAWGTRSAAWALSRRRWPRRAGKGVEIVTGAPVEEIIVERGRAAGVVAGGRAYPHEPSRRACIPSSCSASSCRRAPCQER
jgi:phytoene dehydrogenase-like protein